MKYHFDHTLYKTIRSILTIVPVLFLTIGIWVFGNTLYFNMEKFTVDVIMNSTRQYKKNQNGQMYVEGGITSSIPLPLTVNSYRTYEEQYVLRTGHSMISSYLFTLLLIYILFFLIQYTKPSKFFSRFCFKFIVNYLYWKQVMAGTKKFGISRREVRFSACKLPVSKFNQWSRKPRLEIKSPCTLVIAITA